MIGRIHLVMVPTTDYDRSIEFYEALGFAKRVDAPFGEGGRWVELFPPDGTAGIALTAAYAGHAGVQTGLILSTDDIAAAHERLRDWGVDVDAEVARPGGDVEVAIGATRVVRPSPAMFFLRDPDGNALLMVQPG
jgi:catechol 2,3-dioxygenase-like lactoylglutathione lyase family enzyme